MGKEQLEIKQEPVEEYEKITIKEEPLLTDINNIKVVANLQIKSEPIDYVEQDLPICRGENVMIKEEFSETFVKSETLVDTSEICNDQIKNEDPLEVHDRKNQDKDLSSNTICTNPSEDYEKKKPFKCSRCEYRTTQKCHLKTHVKTVHDGTKASVHKKRNKPNQCPFQCTLCSKAFNLKAVLKRHFEQVHDKIKPFHCSFCPSTFGYKFELEKHLSKIHEKNKPNKCPNCPARFEYGGELNNHLTLVHGGRVFNA